MWTSSLSSERGTILGPATGSSKGGSDDSGERRRLRQGGGLEDEQWRRRGLALVPVV